MKRLVKKILPAVFLTLVGIFFLCLLFSPRLSYLLLTRGTSSDTVTLYATSHDCALVRRGIPHADGIRCALDYTFNGSTVSAKTWVWETDGVFVSLSMLHRRLAWFNQGAQVEIDIDKNDPAHPVHVPHAWFLLSASASSLILYAGLIVAVVVFATKVLNTKKVERRADYDYDEQGRLVRTRFDGNKNVIPLMFALCLLWTGLFAATIYALTNWPANHALFLGRPGMVQTPAILTHCVWNHHGGSKGHDQNECDFSYSWQGSKLTGQAEALDFFLFPTSDRLDDTTDAAEGRRITAYVDPAQPGYAIAFISDDFFAPQSVSLGVIFWFLLGTLYAWIAWRGDGKWRWERHGKFF